MTNIKELMYITKGTVTHLTDLEQRGNINNLIDYFEEEIPDSSYFFDVDFESLIETLIFNGIDYSEILKRNNAIYGHYIDFYYFTDLEIYVMELGVN